MASQTKSLPAELAQLELPDLAAFNTQVTKLVSAGLPIRFSGAPNSMQQWLQGITQRVAESVVLGRSAADALGSDPQVNPAYLSALSAWIQSRRGTSAGDRPEPLADRSLEVLQPWIQSGVDGDRQMDKSSLYAFWLWVLAAMASVVLVHSVWSIYPKLQSFYENSGFEIGSGYRWLEWLYARLTSVAVVLAGVLLAAPFAWRLWFQRVAKHWKLSEYFSRGFFLAYIILGGAITAILGWTVFWPVIELLIRVGEPLP